MASVPAGRPSRYHPALSQRQALALLEEAGSVRNLMRDSVEAIRTLRNVSEHGDTVFTLGSIGVEKAMKVMLGCAAVEKTGAWPSKGTLIDWGHDLEELGGNLTTAIEDGLDGCTQIPRSRGLAGRITTSTVLPLVFATFGRYGRTGRFHHLDVLATNEPGHHDPPSAYWDEVEYHVMTTEPAIGWAPLDDSRAFEEHQGRLRARIAEELDVWWFCVHGLAIQGCFGRLGVQVGREIWDHRRPAPAGM